MMHSNCRRVAGTSDVSAVAMQTALNRCGVKAISIGQNYLIGIPVAALFLINLQGLLGVVCAA